MGPWYLVLTPRVATLHAAHAGTCGSGGVNDGTCPPWVSTQPNSYASMPDVRAADGSVTTYGNEHILFRNLGNVTDHTTRLPKVLWMRIVNESTYRAWNPRHNGVKRQSEGVLEGFFGAINLLGARTTSQRPTAKFWNTQYSLVQLRYEFYTEMSTGSYETARAAGNGMTGLTPQDIGRTFFSFWDLDQGQPTFSGSFTQIEAFQMGPQAYRVRAAVRRTRADTALRTQRVWPVHNGACPDGVVSHRVRSGRMRVVRLQSFAGLNTEVQTTTSWSTLLTAADVGTWLAQYGGNTMCACMLHAHIHTCGHARAKRTHALTRPRSVYSAFFW
jgi:hypothetical protein